MQARCFPMNMISAGFCGVYARREGYVLSRLLALAPCRDADCGRVLEGFETKRRTPRSQYQTGRCCPQRCSCALLGTVGRPLIGHQGRTLMLRFVFGCLVDYARRVLGRTSCCWGTAVPGARWSRVIPYGAQRVGGVKRCVF